MTAMGGVFYGYLIGDDIQVDIKASALIRVAGFRRSDKRADAVIFLGETTMALLLYLLERVGQEVLSYDDILHDVWDRRGLVSSHKRLGLVIKELKGRLKAIGASEVSIVTVRGQGYSISLPSIIRLYGEPLVMSRKNGAVPVDIS